MFPSDRGGGEGTDVGDRFGVGSSSPRRTTSNNSTTSSSSSSNNKPMIQQTAITTTTTSNDTTTIITTPSPYNKRILLVHPLEALIFHNINSNNNNNNSHKRTTTGLSSSSSSPRLYQNKTMTLASTKTNAASVNNHHDNDNDYYNDDIDDNNYNNGGYNNGMNQNGNLSQQKSSTTHHHKNHRTRHWKITRYCCSCCCNTKTTTTSRRRKCFFGGMVVFSFLLIVTTIRLITESSNVLFSISSSYDIYNAYNYLIPTDPERTTNDSPKSQFLQTTSEYGTTIDGSSSSESYYVSSFMEQYALNHSNHLFDTSSSSSSSYSSTSNSTSITRMQVGAGCHYWIDRYKNVPLSNDRIKSTYTKQLEQYRITYDTHLSQYKRFYSSKLLLTTNHTILSDDIRITLQKMGTSSTQEHREFCKSTYYNGFHKNNKKSLYDPVAGMLLHSLQDSTTHEDVSGSTSESHVLRHNNRRRQKEKKKKKKRWYHSIRKTWNRYMTNRQQYYYNNSGDPTFLKKEEKYYKRQQIQKAQSIYQSNIFSYSSKNGYMEPIVPPFIHPTNVCRTVDQVNQQQDSSTSTSGSTKDMVPKLNYLVHDYGAFCKQMKSTSRTVLIDIGYRKRKPHVVVVDDDDSTKNNHLSDVDSITTISNDDNDNNSNIITNHNNNNMMDDEKNDDNNNQATLLDHDVIDERNDENNTTLLDHDTIDENDENHSTSLLDHNNMIDEKNDENNNTTLLDHDTIDEKNDESNSTSLLDHDMIDKNNDEYNNTTLLDHDFNLTLDHDLELNNETLDSVLGNQTTIVVVEDFHERKQHRRRRILGKVGNTRQKRKRRSLQEENENPSPEFKLHSTIYLTNQYRKFGIHFDDVYCYEDHDNEQEEEKILSYLPTYMRDTFHFIQYNDYDDNLGSTEDLFGTGSMENRNNPFSILLTGNYSVDDFVVVKIDLDDFSFPTTMDHRTTTTNLHKRFLADNETMMNDQLNDDEVIPTTTSDLPEMYILRQILNDEKLLSIIDVLYVDHHKFRSHSTTNNNNNNNNHTSSMKELMEILIQLRRKGLSAHAWV